MGLVHPATYRVLRYRGICSRDLRRHQTDQPPYLRIGFWMCQCRLHRRSSWDTVAVNPRTPGSVGFRGCSRCDVHTTALTPRQFFNGLMAQSNARSKNACNNEGKIPARPVKMDLWFIPLWIRLMMFPRLRPSPFSSHLQR